MSHTLGVNCWYQSYCITPCGLVITIMMALLQLQHLLHAYAHMQRHILTSLAAAVATRYRAAIQKPKHACTELLSELCKSPAVRSFAVWSVVQPVPYMYSACDSWQAHNQVKRLKKCNVQHCFVVMQRVDLATWPSACQAFASNTPGPCSVKHVHKSSHHRVSLLYQTVNGLLSS
jgi:hypothetical protein